MLTELWYYSTIAIVALLLMIFVYAVKIFYVLKSFQPPKKEIVEEPQLYYKGLKKKDY